MELRPQRGPRHGGSAAMRITTKGDTQMLQHSKLVRGALLAAMILTVGAGVGYGAPSGSQTVSVAVRSEEHTSELQSRPHLVCRLLLEKKKKRKFESNVC